MVGGAKALTKRGLFDPLGMTYERAMNDPNIFPIFAAVIWGCVMCKSEIIMYIYIILYQSFKCASANAS
jgi:hypothetical protein